MSIDATDFPLRQRKQAQTRLSLLDAVLTRLSDRTLDEIPVQELCDAVSISPASFFNYFPNKSAVLVYFVQLWSLELAWRVRHELAGRPAREAIHEVFAATARQARERPGVMREVLAYQARQAAPIELAELPVLDRLLAYPGRDGIESVPAVGLDGLLPPLIERAVVEGDLPAATDPQLALLGFAAIFFGVPIVLLRSDPSALEGAYRAALDVHWAGLQRTSARSAPRRSAAAGGKPR